jgi:tRNA pseudouridine55 synthase
MHGLLLIDKPKDWTSHDLVARSRKILNTSSVGHCGTLDPIASGLMVLLVGEATKISQYILENDKSYTVTARLGFSTDTYDTTGKIVDEKPIEVTAAQVLKAALDFQGEFEIPVPIYSAAKVGGQKLYEYARSGREDQVEIPKKKMKFYNVSVVAQTSNTVTAEISCSKGSFIRSWVHLLGQNLGTGAAMSELRRTSSLPFHLNQAVTIDQLQSEMESGGAKSGFVPLSSALPHFKTVRVSGLSQTLMGNGQISHDLKTQLISVFTPGVDVGVKVLPQRGNELLALIGFEQGRGFNVKRVFRY